MKLRSVVKLCTFVSVALFCLAMGYYAFMRLDMARRNRSFNLYSIVPSNCIGVLESDDVSTLFHEMSIANYSREFQQFQFPGLMNFILTGLSEYAENNAHGLDYQMNRLLVSFHAPGTPRDQVIYFQINPADESLLTDMFAEYAPNDFLPKEEDYRGKRIVIYPLGHTEYLTAYSEDGFLAVSFQKRLIEQVVDTRLDGESLDDDEVFASLKKEKKSQELLSLYSRSMAVPLLNREGSGVWSEYDIHVNSDVLYLAGDVYAPEDAEELYVVPEEPFFVKELGLMISTDKDSTEYYIHEASEEVYRDDLFERCVANLTQDAVFTMVVDMQHVWLDKERFKAYLPKFVQENALVFRPFILSVQYTMHNGGLSHFWVFTYKD